MDRTIQKEVVVIGSGMAGLMATVVLQELGKDVTLLANGMGSLAHFSGTVDLLGSEEFMSPWSGIGNLRDTKKQHPYTSVTDEEISKALEIYQEVLGKYGIEYVTLGSNVFLPTAMGTRKPSYLVPKTMLPQGKDYTVVDFTQFRDWKGSLIHKGLREHYHGLELCSIELPHVKSLTLDAVSLARYFEKAEWRKEFISILRKQKLKGSLLMPAVLGIRGHEEIVAELEAALGHQVIEVPTLPPSAPGRRVYEAFMQRLKPNVEILYNNRVLGIEEGLKLRVSRPGRQWCYGAKSVIWAGGGLLGGGLVPAKDGLRDTVLGITITEGWQAGSQPIKGLYIAGSQLGYYDWPLEKSGAGVALSTGYKAAMLAGGGYYE